MVTNKPNNPSNKPSEEDNVNTHEGSQSQKGKEVGTQPSVIEAQNVSPEREQKAKDIVSKLNDELKKPKTERDLTLFADDNITLMEVFSGSAEHHNEQSVNISSHTVLQQRNNSEWDFVRCAESDGHLKVYIKPKEVTQNTPIIEESKEKNISSSDMSEAKEKEMVSKLTEQEKKQYEEIKQTKGLRLANNVTEEILKKFLIVMQEENSFILDSGMPFINHALEELQTGKDYYLINDDPNYLPIIRYNPKNTGTILGPQVPTHVNGKTYYNKFMRPKQAWEE